ncbi:MAG: hypothetical protein AAGI63_13330 [Planctomycetota bacterium]
MLSSLYGDAIDHRHCSEASISFVECVKEYAFDNQLSVVLSRSRAAIMDEPDRKYRLSRRFVFLVAISVGTVSYGYDSSGESVRARLASGFGAGTNQGIVQRATTRRATARVSRRETAGNSGKLDAPGDSGQESKKLEDGSLLPLPKQKRQLADLIRVSNADRSTTISTNGSAESDRYSSGNSMRVAVAPTVRRIQLGAYDPEISNLSETGLLESDSFVRLAEPVDPVLLPRPKAKVIVIPRLSTKSATVEVESSPPTHDLPQLPKVDEKDQLPELDEKNSALSTPPLPHAVRPQAATPVLMHAEAAPELTGMIEARVVSTQTESAAAHRLDKLATERSRRLAGLHGFDLLPIDRIGQE